MDILKKDTYSELNRMMANELVHLIKSKKVASLTTFSIYFFFL